MNSEIKTTSTSSVRACQNCKKDFIIEPDDFGFYEKIKVPVPTWCYRCRLQRILSFRNERTLFKRICNAPGHDEEIISMYSPENDLKVYDQKYWWSDAWDPMQYGREYDFNKTFFEQFKELMRDVPWMTVFNMNAVNSDYCNYTTDNKNCYLVFGGDINENCAYSTFNFTCRECLDLYWVDKSELCYELIDSANCYRCFYGAHLGNCADCMFMYNCVGCTNCFGCVNLKNKSYCIFNEQYSKEEYERKIKELAPEKFSNREKLWKQFNDLRLKQPHRYANIIQSVNSTGENLYQVKNCIDCFDALDGADDCRHSATIGYGVKDVHSSYGAGHKNEMVHESLAVFGG